MSRIFIGALRFLHLAILLFVLLGWLAPWRNILLLHAAFVPLMILHWKTNNDTCCLTSVEQQLRGSHRENTAGSFIKSILLVFFVSLPPDSVIQRYLYLTLFTTWGVGVLRLLDF